MAKFDALLRNTRLLVSAAALCLLGACVNPADQPTEAAANDPIEPFNRYVFEVNRFGDEFFLKPAATIYRGTVPDSARESVSNAVANLRLPWTAANDIFQGEFARAGNATARFVLNSTFGFFGLFDMAKDVGFPHHDEDFGQTLGAWGMTGDPYIVLPLLGPSSPRDAGGRFVDSVLDPVTIAAKGGTIGGSGNAFTTSRSVVSLISGRERALEAIAELERGQDFYAAVRSAYRQSRAAEIRNEDGTAAPRRFRYAND
jgi:phospholipid-binding lipoprotein MlaA